MFGEADYLHWAKNGAEWKVKAREDPRCNSLDGTK